VTTYEVILFLFGSAVVLVLCLLLIKFKLKRDPRGK
jgi:hypothetical protein